MTGKWLIFLPPVQMCAGLMSLGVNIRAYVHVLRSIALKQISSSHVVTSNKYRCPSCKTKSITGSSLGHDEGTSEFCEERSDL